MRLISKIFLGLAFTFSLAALSACGDDSGPEDLYWPVDYSTIKYDLTAVAHTDAGAGDAAQ